MAVEGPSAVGKTTVTRLIADRTDWTVLGEASLRIDPRLNLRVASPSDLLRIERRLLIEERRRCRSADRLRAQGVDVLLDTAPFGPATYAMGMAQRKPVYISAGGAIVDQVLRDLESQRLTVPDRVVYLTAPEAILRRRAEASVVDHPLEFADRHREVARFERGFWEEVAERSHGSVVLLHSKGPPSRDATVLLSRLAKPAPRLSARLLRSRLREARQKWRGLGTEIVKNRARSRRPPRR